MSHYDDFPVALQVMLVVITTITFASAIMLGMLLAHYCYY